MSSRPARAAFRRPAGFRLVGPPIRIAPVGGPPYAFASLQRPIAARPHRPGVPKDPRDGRCSLPWAFVPIDTYRNGGPAVLAGLPAPRVPRPRFGHLLRGVHHRTCEPPCEGSSVHGLLPSRRSPRIDRAPFREPRPSGRSKRLATPCGAGDAVDFRASISMRARSVRRIPRDPTRRCLLGVHPSRAFSPSARPCALIAHVYPITRWAV